MKLIQFDLRKLKKDLQRARLATVAAMEMGDCRAVARLTCEAARLQHAVDFAGSRQA